MRIHVFLLVSVGLVPVGTSVHEQKDVDASFTRIRSRGGAIPEYTKYSSLWVLDGVARVGIADCV